MGTNILKMSEEQFWQCTPKKLQALFNIYKSINGLSDDGMDTIDNIIF
jgi:hypothetical protein